MTDTHESDEQFVDRMTRLMVSTTDVDRLLSLALRGAAVRWRPIQEAAQNSTEHLCLKVTAGKAKRVYGPYLAWFDLGHWRTIDGSRVYPTHYIPLTALGEPDDR